MPLMGIREYARHRGISHVSVLNAIKNGKLPTAVVKGPDGNTAIDQQKADTEWMASSKEVFKDQPVKPVPTEQDEADKVNSDLAAETQRLFNKAKAQTQIYKVKQAKLEYQRNAGELVEVKKVQDEWVSIAGVVRTKILALPTKLKQNCPDLTSDQMTMLERIVREALEELSGGD